MSGISDRSVPILQYIKTEEAVVDSEAKLQLSAGAYHRFGICPGSEIQIEFDIAGEPRIEAAPGELFYLPEGRFCLIASSSTSNVSVHLISFRCCNESGHKTGLIEPYAPCSFRMPQMKNWLIEFIAEESTRKPTDYFKLQSRLYAIASAYCKAASQPACNEAQIAGYVEQTRRRIVVDYDSALDMEELARSSGAGASRFYSTFRKHTGLSPLKFLITTRLNASLRLLADPFVSVAEAAHSVGYSDEFYFSRLFKKQMGVTPTEYAARARISIACLCPIFPGDLAVLGITPRVSLEREWDEEETNRERRIQEIKLAEPQLMLTGPLAEPLRAELSGIAPVSIVNWKHYSWKKRLIEFGRLLELVSVAERWLSDYDRKIDNARQLVRERYPETPFLIIGVRPDNFRVFGTRIRKFTDLIYDELRFKSPPAAEDVEFIDSGTLTEAASMDCDNVIFLIEFPVDEAFFIQLEREWGRLKGGERIRRCLFIRLEQPFLYNALMHERLVDQLVSLLHADEVK